ncbi:metallophosphoesterase [Candidatus Woesearchaeota archaeon]|nr:metallophosphoesterase [Candidatus Woesearchaeota archaeon]
MKIIVFSDLHGNFDNLEKLQNFQNLFFLGDIFTNKDFVRLIGKDFLSFYSKRIDTETLYSRFSIVKGELSQLKMEIPIPTFFKEKDMYILPGNHETKNYYENLKRLPNLHDLHLKKMQINGIEFVGHGGMISPDDI